MYEAFYNLDNDPFRLLPDPGICFPHRSCARAWAYLRYALKRGEGIVVVTGPPGSGKTTLAERLLGDLNPARIVSVRLIANDLNAGDLLRKLAYSLGLPAEGMDRAMLAHRIERYLIELEHTSRRALVVIDEAQTLSHQALEAMRLLTDLQSRSRPVLQLILLGQEELEGVMSAPGMEQFQHRVIASCRLHTMDLAETKAYLEYRLAYADWRGDPAISGPAVMAIYRHSKGLPRHVNKICSRLFLHGCTEEKHAFDEQDVRAVVSDLRDELLAPLGGDAGAAEVLATGVFESVYDLALVPSARSAASQGAAGRKATPDLAPAEQPAAASPPAPSSAVAPGHDGDPWPSAASRHEGYPHRPNRRRPGSRHRLAGAVRAWAGRGRDAVRVAAPQWRRGLADAARVALAGLRQAAARGAVGLRGLRRLGAQAAAAAPRLDGRGKVLAAGLSLSLVVGLVWLVSSTGAGHGTAPAGSAVAGLPTGDGAVRADGTMDQQSDDPRVVQAAGTPGSDAALGGNPVTSVAEDEAAGMVTVLPSPAAVLEPDRLAQVSGVDEEISQPLLGRVSGEAAGLLLGQATRQDSSLDLWTPPAVAADAGMPESNDIAPQAVAPSLANGAAVLAASGDTAQPLPLHLDGPGDPLDFSRQLPPPAAGPTAVPAADAVIAMTAVDADARPAQPVDAPADVQPEVAAGQGAVNVNDPDDRSQRPQAELVRLVALGDDALARDRLLLPESESAYAYYRAALAIDPTDEAARRGMARIVDRYAYLADRALSEADFDKAERYVGRALRVDPQDTEALSLRQRIAEADAEAEAAAMAAAQLSRMAAEIPRPDPVVVEPKKKKLSSFERLMRNVDGHGFAAEP